LTSFAKIASTVGGIATIWGALNYASSENDKHIRRISREQDSIIIANMWKQTRKEFMDSLLLGQELDDVYDSLFDHRRDLEYLYKHLNIEPRFRGK